MNTIKTKTKEVQNGNIYRKRTASSSETNTNGYCQRGAYALGDSVIS